MNPYFKQILERNIKRLAHQKKDSVVEPSIPSSKSRFSSIRTYKKGIVLVEHDAHERKGRHNN